MKYALTLVSVLLLACDSGTPLEPFPPSGSSASFTVARNITCVRGSDAAAYCWGASIAGVVPFISPVGGALHFASVFGGAGRHVCALTDLHAAYCWGDGQFGQLGNARANMIALQPVAVTGNLKWRDLAAGGSYTCGVTTTGDLYCWGTHDFGAECTDTFEQCAVPRMLSAPVKFRATSASTNYACALGEDDAAYCWGTVPAVGSFRNPTLITGNHRFSSVSVGWRHACGVGEGNAVFCWGYNQYGALGVPFDALPVCDQFGPCTAAPVKVAGGLAFRTVSAGYFHTCGITLGGKAYCWGANYAGELGIGSDSITTSFQPAAVASTEMFASIAASQSGHTCALSQGKVFYCWGNNVAGEVGADTTRIAYNAPVRVDAQLLPH